MQSSLSARRLNRRDVRLGLRLNRSGRLGRLDPQGLGLGGRRAFATVLGGGNDHSADRGSPDSPGNSDTDYASPSSAAAAGDGQFLPWPASKYPTPYDIFGQAKKAPYRKALFYDLVKQYHPDRKHHMSDHARQLGLTASVMTERYRMVVAANRILSDPAKRRMYDLYGTGWTHHPPGGKGDAKGDAQSLYREADRSWRQQSGHAAHNATWEDWEQWRNERDGNGKQEPQFLSNGGFGVLVLLAFFLAGYGQVTWANSRSMQLLDTAEQQHRRVSQTLWQQQREVALLSREDRVGHFLERREGWGYMLPPSPRSVGAPQDKTK